MYELRRCSGRVFSKQTQTASWAPGPFSVSKMAVPLSYSSEWLLILSRVPTARGNFSNRSRPAGVSPQRAEPSQQLLSSNANDGGQSRAESEWSAVIQNSFYTDQGRPLQSLFSNADTGPSFVSGEGATGLHRHSSGAQQARLRRAEPSDSAISKSPANTTSTTRYDSSHQISEASEFLDQELKLRTELSQHRYAVLKAAAEFVNRNFQPGNTFQEPAYLGHPLPEENLQLRPFSPEIFYMMSIGMSSRGESVNDR